MDHKEVTYTDSGRKRMEKAIEEYRSVLEHVMRRARFVPGEDVVEITASDVEHAVHLLDVRPRTATDLRETIIWTYTVLGAITIGVGLFYSQAKELFFQQPERLMIVGMGLAMILAARYMSQRLRRRPYRRFVDPRESTSEKVTSDDFYP